MVKLVELLVVIVIATGIEAATDNGTCPQFCPENLDPICSSDPSAGCAHFENDCHRRRYNCQQRKNFTQTDTFQCNGISVGSSVVTCPPPECYEVLKKCSKTGGSVCVQDETGRICRKFASECYLARSNCVERTKYKAIPSCSCTGIEDGFIALCTRDCPEVSNCVQGAEVCGTYADLCRRFTNDCNRARYNCDNNKNFTKIDTSSCYGLETGTQGACTSNTSCPNLTNCRNSGGSVCSTDGSKCAVFCSECAMRKYNCENNATFVSTGRQNCSRLQQRGVPGPCASTCPGLENCSSCAPPLCIMDKESFKCAFVSNECERLRRNCDELANYKVISDSYCRGIRRDSPRSTCVQDVPGLDHCREDGPVCGIVISGSNATNYMLFESDCHRVRTNYEENRKYGPTNMTSCLGMRPGDRKQTC